MEPGATTGRESPERAHQQRPDPNGGPSSWLYGVADAIFGKPGISFAFGEPYDDQLG